jgi:hypothetical protein
MAKKKSGAGSELSSPQKLQLLSTLKARFEKNMKRHPGVDWNLAQSRLENSPSKCWSLYQMENTGGEPDIVGQDKGGVFVFVDCAPESPKDRRSLCYDREALDSRKENKPSDSAMEMAEAMGASILTEEQYRGLQRLGEFDTKTSSWIETPAAIRKRGGALFCDRRYDAVFIYHNGAESYYAARGFRAMVKV